MSGISKSTGGSVGEFIGVTGEYVDGAGYSGISIGGYLGPGLLPVSIHHMVENAWVFELDASQSELMIECEN